MSRATVLSGPRVFLVSLGVLALLPLVPEAVLQLQSGSDLKRALPIFYYQAIVSFLVLLPVLLLPRRWAAGWAIMSAVALGAATGVVGFYAFTQGARWNLTAYSAAMQTNGEETRAYLSTFVSFGRMGATLLLITAFGVAAYYNVRAERPTGRTRLIVVLAGFVVGGYGFFNVLVYGREIRRDITVADGGVVRLIGEKVNMLHPLTLVLATHLNYRSTHAYYLGQFQRVEANEGRLAGARLVAGATMPRVVVVVIGESANRRHWSLYGYPRPTTPRLQALGGEVFAFSDVISNGVGTLASIKGMLTTERDSLPVFKLFSGAGYETHWLSAQHNQGFDDLELGALARSCDHRTFLNGAYDENLLPLLQAAVAASGPQLIFLNLMGSHVRYRDRYPTKFAEFKGDGEAAQLRAEYDNSIRYTDHVLGEMIAMLRARDESNCLLYVSDHGEDVYDSRPDKYLFRADSLATDPMYEVPFVVWLSPAYARENTGFTRALAAATSRPYQNRGLYHAILSLARLQHPLHDPRADLFSPEFVERERRVGSMERVYRATAAPASR